MSAAASIDDAPNLAVTEESFITVSSTTLPNGTVVPAFAVARYLSGQGTNDHPTILREATPWTRINYRAARKACKSIGGTLITELQWLAIAHLIAQQPGNWTRGKVGAGSLYQGLHLWTRSGAQPATYESPKKTERRWFVLPGGERIYDFAGNVFSWVFDDVQGDGDGLIAKPFAADSPTLATAPYPSLKKGMGWMPSVGADWSGNALVRGGCWYSDSLAGVFYLYRDWPVYASGYVGFRCTKPGL